MLHNHPSSEKGCVRIGGGAPYIINHKLSPLHHLVKQTQNGPQYGWSTFVLDDKFYLCPVKVKRQWECSIVFTDGFPEMMKCLDWPLRGPSLTTSQKSGPKSREVEHLGQKRCSVVELRFEGLCASWPQKTWIMCHCHYINLMLKLNFYWGIMYGRNQKPIHCKDALNIWSTGNRILTSRNFRYFCCVYRYIIHLNNWQRLKFPPSPISKLLLSCNNFEYFSRFMVFPTILIGEAVKTKKPVSSHVF